MPSLSKRMLLIGAALLAAGGLLGAALDAVGWGLFAGMSLFFGVFVLEAGEFVRWSQRPLQRPNHRDPVWDRATTRIYKGLNRERRRSKSMLEQLRSLQLVTEALPDGAVVLNEAGEIVQLNASARLLLRLSDTDLGQPISSLIRHPEVTELLKGQFPENTIELPSPFEPRQQLELRLYHAPDDREVLLVRDVTELNRLLSMRQDFIANVSHELRSPLTVIVGYLEAMDEESLDADSLRELVARLRSPTTRMQALVQDLLLLTRLESAPVPTGADLDLVSVTDLLRQIANDVGALAHADHELQIEVHSDARVIGKESELYSAFSNLVTNALRYSPGGGKIRVAWEDCEEGARFSVQDDGVGIAQEHIARLTERFYRVDLGSARVRGGTGLGLAIVKHVLRRHGTELAVSSVMGEGSNFSCVFEESHLERSALAAL